MDIRLKASRTDIYPAKGGENLSARVVRFGVITRLTYSVRILGVSVSGEVLAIVRRREGAFVEILRPTQLLADGRGAVYFLPD